MKESESGSKKNKILGVSTTVLNIIVLLLAYSLGRIYPLPVAILAVIYFSVVLGIAVNKHNAAKASGADASESKKEIQSNIVWMFLMALVVGFQVWSLGGFQPNSPGSNPQTPAELASYGATEAKKAQPYLIN